MGRDAIFHPEFREDLRCRMKADRRVALRALDLIEDILGNPFSGIGKPEPLKYLAPGTWPRCHTQEHRLVYPVRDDRIDSNEPTLRVFLSQCQNLPTPLCSPRRPRRPQRKDQREAARAYRRAVRPPEKIGRGLYASPGGSCVYDWSPNEVRVPCGAILSVAFAVVVNPCFLLLAPRSLLPAPKFQISLARFFTGTLSLLTVTTTRLTMSRAFTAPAAGEPTCLPVRQPFLGDFCLQRMQLPGAFGNRPKGAGFQPHLLPRMETSGVIRT
jgi:toxin YoeB